MSLLLDTCTFIWLVSAPDKLSSVATSIIDGSLEIYLSDISILEINIKWERKKLSLPQTPRIWVESQIKEWNLSELKLDREHIYRTSELALHHKDPFDRLLIAQAISENMTILTPDESIKDYPVSVIW